jgi:hypothetical protein
MQGRRLADGWHYHRSADVAAWGDPSPATEPCQPGDYWKQLMATREEAGDAPQATGPRNRDWYWTICDPRGSLGMITTHEVTEHPDGTITVHPSILDPNGWHGWLERGVWREV